MSDLSEIVKSGAADKLADIVHKLAGPLSEELGLLLADKVKAYRVKNWVSVVAKTQRILDDANLPPKAVPPRMFLPILEASSLEDDETLQDLWAGLLATSSQQTDSISPSFVETLKQLTPDEARHLEHVYKTLQESRNRETLANSAVTPYAFTGRWGAPSGVSSDTFERLGLIRRDFDVKLRSRSPRGRQARTIEEVVDIDEAIDALEAETRYGFVLTPYVVGFLEACHGPRAPLSQAVLNLVAEIRTARTLDELKSIWTAAYKSAKDDATRKLYIEAKEARHKKLAKTLGRAQGP